MKIKKGIPLIDQHDKNGFYGGKFGGNYVAETAIQPIKDLSNLFEKCRKDKKFLKERIIISKVTCCDNSFFKTREFN